MNKRITSGFLAFVMPVCVLLFAMSAYAAPSTATNGALPPFGRKQKKFTL